MPRVPAAQGRLNHDPGSHLNCDENLSEGWGPPLLFAVTMYEKLRGPLPENKTTRDTTQDPDQYKQLEHDNQHLRQALKNATGEVNAVNRDRAAALEDLEICRKRFAYSKLSWIAEREKQIHGADAVINVDVRFATPDDHFLAMKIRDIIEVHTHWPVTLDGGNKPAIEPNNDCKVLFESDLTFDKIANVFKSGNLLDDVPRDRRLRQADRCAQGPSAPRRDLRRRRFQCARDHRDHAVVADRPGRPRPRLVAQPFEATQPKPFAPLTDAVARRAQPRGDRSVRQTVRTAQHDPRAQRQTLRRLRAARPFLQGSAFGVRQHQRFVVACSLHGRQRTNTIAKVQGFF